MCGYKKEGGEWLEKTLAANVSQNPDDLLTRANVLAKLPWLVYFRSHSEKKALALGRTLGPAGLESMALALWGMGADAFYQTDYARAKSLEEQSLQLFRQLGHRWGICETLTHLGKVMITLGDYQQATVLLEESLELARQARDTNEIAFALQELGQVAMARADYAQAHTFFEQSQAFYQEIDQCEGSSYGLLGDVALQQGDTSQADSWYKKNLAHYWGSGDQISIASSLGDLAHVAIVRRQPERAARLFGAAEALRESSGEALLPLSRLEYEHFLETFRPQLDNAACQARWAEGRAMTLKDAVAFALNDKDM